MTTTNAPRSLAEIYKRYSAEEGSGDKGTAHSYIERFYELKFAELRYSCRTMLEIGVSTGLSLEMWAEYFENSIIYGLDKDQLRYTPSTQRIKLFKGDSTKSLQFLNFPDDFDIIIDDGSHFLQSQVRTYGNFYPRLKRGGLYVIEDVRDIDRTLDVFLKLNTLFELYDFRKFKGRSDDVILLALKT